MPKKQSKNAFFYFMVDWKTTQEAKGRTFPNGMRDVQADPECNEAWRGLSDQQKLPYQTRAKNGKYANNREKMTTTGESVQRIKEQEQKEIDWKLNMEAHIRYMVYNAKKYNVLANQKFLFLHVNWYYMRQPDNAPVDYLPAEFALAEFSVEGGVSAFYHEIIKTELHLGYMRDAIENSEKTHKLSWDLPFAEDNWLRIYDKFMGFLKERMINDKIPPIYTRKKIIHTIPSLLRRMTEEVGESLEMFNIYTIESLFATMQRAVSTDMDSNALGILAESRFSKELFAYTPNIECEFHKTQDGTSRYCSLSVVRQWGFDFCDSCCQPLKINPIPGVHVPYPAKDLLNSADYRSSTRSLCSSVTPSVLSATGVSERHRILVSEKPRRGSVKETQESNRVLTIIDHSKFNEEDRLNQNTQTNFATAVAAPPPRRPRAPATASQALRGIHQEAPPFDMGHFPTIGGPASRNAEEPRHTPDTIWTRRDRQNSGVNSDMDSD